MDTYNLARKYIMKRFGRWGTGIQSINTVGSELVVIFCSTAYSESDADGDGRTVHQKAVFTIIKKKGLFGKEKRSIDLISLERIARGQVNLRA